MTAVSISKLGTDFYAPTFEVRVGGTPVSRQAVHDILSVTYKDALEAIDSFELTINNWDENTLTFKYSDGDQFAPGQRVEIDLGYRDSRLVPVLVGEITSLTPNFPSGGVPTLTVGGLSILHQLRKKQQSAVFENKKDSQIAKQIASNLGVTIETDQQAELSEPLHEYVLQHSEYDIIFLLKRARRIGYELVVREGPGGNPSLYFGPARGGKVVPFKLFWGGSLLSFSPKLTTANQVGTVVVRSWHPTSKKPIEGKATRGDIGGREPFTDAFNERQEVIADRPVKNEGEANQLARETLRRIQEHYITASGSTVGLPALRTGALVAIERLGDRFDGNYFVTGTTHTIGDSGYVTKFEARKEPT